MFDIKAYLESVLSPGGLLLALMFGDFLFGVIVAIKQKRFKWDLLPQFLLNDGAWILVWLFCDAVMYFFNAAIPDALAVVLGAGFYLPVAGKIGASLAGHFSALGFLTNGFSKLAIPPTAPDKEDAVG